MLMHTSVPLNQTEAEQAMAQKLKAVFETDEVQVEDNSGKLQPLANLQRVYS
jgi:hypothetical protein